MSGSWRHRVLWLILGSALAACTAPPVVGPSPETTPTDPRVDPTSTAARVPVQPGTVIRTIDGDTIEVRFDGRRERVRLIGMDAPERGQRFAGEATAFTSRRVDGRRVYLEVGVEERDRFGRLLAYVWLEPPVAAYREEVREKMLNAALVLEGLAVLLTIPPNVRYADDFAVFVEEARAARRGLWR